MNVKCLLTETSCLLSRVCGKSRSQGRLGTALSGPFGAEYLRVP